MKPEKPKQLPEVFYKKSVLKSFEKFTGNTCAGVSFLIKLQAFKISLLKSREWYKYFPANFAKFLRILFLENKSGPMNLRNSKIKAENKRISSQAAQIS